MRMKITFLTILIIVSISAKAQKADSVTNEELNRYAVMMDSLETLKKQRNDISTKLAKGDTKITAARYQQLLPIIDDQKKLAAAKASSDEIAYVKKALTSLTEEGQKFQTAFTSLMNEYVGYNTYNKVRKAIETNKHVKDRYTAEMKARNGVRLQ
jgi:seryl-tRNA synthetase